MRGKDLGVVSKWMLNVNINQFIKVNRGADRFELVGYHSCFLLYPILMACAPWQLKGVAGGLIYIHNRGIIHGDLRGV